MAVVRVVHAARHADCLAESENGSGFCFWRSQAVGYNDVVEWESPQDVVIHWGDPVAPVHAPSLAALARAGRPLSQFGRSWVHYHRPTHRLTVVADRLGLFPVLLTGRQGRTRVASDPLAMVDLLGSEARPDYQAALELLGHGQLLSRRTGLDGVRRLAAGASVRIDGHGKTQESTPDPWHPLARPSDESAARETLVAALKRRLDRDTGALVGLSTHLPDRLLLAASLAAGARPGVCSLEGVDSRVLDLTRGAGLSLLTADLSGAGHLPTALLGGGLVPLHRGSACLAPALLDRHGGALLLTAADDPHPPLTVDSCFAAALPDQAAELLQILAQVRPSAGPGRGVVDRQQLLNRHFARSHPLWDEDVVTVLAGLPWDLRQGQRFARRTVGRLAPRLAAVAVNHTPLVAEPDPRADLQDLLLKCGLERSRALLAERRLLAGPLREHALGVAGAFTRWSRHLEQPRRCQAA